MRRGLLRLVVALVLLAGYGLSGAADWKRAASDYAWSFPRDHWAHPEYRTEWWYFTGHLRSMDEPGRRFGYQFTFFRIGLVNEPLDLDSAWNADHLIMGHAAVSDLGRGDHRFSETLYRATPFLGQFAVFPDPDIAWSRGPVGTPGRWTLAWNGEAFDMAMVDAAQRMSFRLSTRPTKPRVLQGPNGFTRKGNEPGAASLYYSFTRLATEGWLATDGERWAVRGESWMDQEFSSSQLGEDQVGWDWFSLQLDDGRELMLYVLRRRDDGQSFRHGTVVSAQGRPRYLQPSEWSVRATGTWESPVTGAIYPAAWSIRLPSEGLSLRIDPLLADQENRSQLAGGVFYWEGAVTVTDSSRESVGRGYVELTGYGENNRPPV